MSTTLRNEDALFNQALGFLHRHRRTLANVATRGQLLSLATNDLVSANDIAVERAQDIVMRAWGELDSASQREYIDVNRTTAHMLTLVDPGTGLNRVITTADLIRLIGPAEIPAPRLIAARH